MEVVVLRLPASLPVRVSGQDLQASAVSFALAIERFAFAEAEALLHGSYEEEWRPSPSHLYARPRPGCLKHQPQQCQSLRHR